MKFQLKQAHVGMDLQKPTKQDKNNTTILYTILTSMVGRLIGQSVGQSVDDLLVLVTCWAGTSATLSSDVKGSVVH